MERKIARNGKDAIESTTGTWFLESLNEMNSITHPVPFRRSNEWLIYLLAVLRVAFLEISVDGENNRGAAAAQHFEAAEEGNESHKCLEIEAGRDTEHHGNDEEGSDFV